MTLDLRRHPCFSRDASHRFARIHLPVAPKCNMQCHFCNRKFDCQNESRPGVTSTLLQPRQALEYLRQAKQKVEKIAVVGIAGPGDPFANAPETMETLRLVRHDDPEMLLCVATNGLQIGPHIEELAELKVSHVTLTINAVDPQIGSRVYAWMRDGTRVMHGVPAAELLLQRQAGSHSWPEGQGGNGQGQRHCSARDQREPRRGGGSHRGGGRGRPAQLHTAVPSEGNDV